MRQEEQEDLEATLKPFFRSTRSKTGSGTKKRGNPYGGTGWGLGGLPYKGPVLVPRRTCSGTGQDVGATVPMAVGRRANVLDRSAPSRSRGLSAAHPRRWAA